jgi:ABC-2 type transport system permease protein
VSAGATSLSGALSARPRELSTLSQTAEVARRSIVRTLRQPAQVVPALIFPLFLLAVNTGGLDAATKIPGFPTDSYLTFALAVPFMQSGIFSLLNGGSDLARDIESGFMDRMALTPISRSALIAGQLAGVATLGLIFGLVFFAVGLGAGAHFEAGIAGVPVLIALAVSITLAFGCIGMFVAARLGSSEAVQGMFPLFFMFLFFSSMSMPRPLIEQDWFKTIATINPVSYLVEGIRSLFIDGFDTQALAMAFGICALFVLIFLPAAGRALGGRLGR